MTPIKFSDGQIEVELQEVMGTDRQIADSAWTSSTTLEGKAKRTQEDVTRVVKMLIAQRHASPIESVVFRFWITMPIQTDRQHMTHRIASHNGMSGRYRTMPREWLEMGQDVKDILNKITYPHDKMRGGQFIEEYEHLCKQANGVYENCMAYAKDAEVEGFITNDEYKRLREFYRGVLPQNNMTERVTVINLRSFANYQKLRNSKHAQFEIRKVAQLMLQCVEQANVCPIALKALKSIGWDI